MPAGGVGARERHVVVGCPDLPPLAGWQRCGQARAMLVDVGADAAGCCGKGHGSSLQRLHCRCLLTAAGYSSSWRHVLPTFPGWRQSRKTRFRLCYTTSTTCVVSTTHLVLLVTEMQTFSTMPCACRPSRESTWWSMKMARAARQTCTLVNAGGSARMTSARPRRCSSWRR